MRYFIDKGFHYYFLLIFLLVISFTPLSGKEISSEQHLIEFSVGEPFTSAWGFNLMFLNSMTEEQLFHQWASESRPYVLPPNISVYKDAWIVPTFSLGYYYQLLNWLEVGGELSTMSMCTTENYLSNEETYAYYLETNLYIAAAVRFNYYHNKITNLYSGLALGTKIRFHSTESTPLLFATAGFTWQLTALGVRFGKKVYGNIEIGYGYKGLLSAGVGCRF